jgi:hypothetical protein
MILLTALLAIFMIVAQSAKKSPKRPARYKTFTVKQKSWSHQAESLRSQAGYRCHLPVEDRNR